MRLESISSFSVWLTVGAAALALSGCGRSVEVVGSGHHGSSGVVSPNDGLPNAGPQTTSGCELQTLATGLSHPTRIKYSNGELYVAEVDPSGGYRIVRIPLSGGTPVTVVHGGLNDFWAFAVDDTTLYFSSEHGSLRSVPLAGGPTTTIVEPSVVGADTASIAVDSHAVYWSAWDGAIRRAPLGGGGELTVLFPAADMTFAQSLVVDSTHLYWVQLTNSLNSILKMPLAGGEATSLLSDSTLGHLDPSDLVQNDENLYLADSGGSFSYTPDGELTGVGRVIKIPIDQSAPPEALATNLPNTMAIAADANGVYFGGGSQDSLGGTNWAPIQRLINGSVDTLASKRTVYGMTTCENAICWTDVATGKVERYVECSH